MRSGVPSSRITRAEPSVWVARTGLSSSALERRPWLFLSRLPLAKIAELEGSRRHYSTPSNFYPGPLRASRAPAPTHVGRKECLQMCDYSLDLVASRPAKVGDKLVTTEFQNSMTRGFAAIGEPNVAVCLLPGTEVAFENEVEYERFFTLIPN